MNLELADIVKLYNRIEDLERRIATLESSVQEMQSVRPAVEEKPPFPVERTRGKYKPLAEYLYGRWEKRIKLSYKEIEDILGFSLPDTARNLPQSYWANTEYHSFAKSSWLAVGYKAKVDVETWTVIFDRNIF